jgi:hypothetical protein
MSQSQSQSHHIMQKRTIIHMYVSGTYYHSVWYHHGTKRYTALFTVGQGPGIPLLKTLTAVTNVVFKARLEHESAADIHFGGSKHHPAYRRGSRSDVTRRHDQRCPHRQ